MLFPKLYNTLSRNVEPIAPREGNVSIYCCGPTVYDVPHAGNARAALVPDILVRLLRGLGFDVTYVRNITDVDDKIIDRARQQGTSPLELSAKMAIVYQDLMRQLGCVPPTHEPKVSENIDDIVQLIQQIIARGSGYILERSNGTRDVYFSVRSFSSYGKLSRRKIDELQVGARIERDEDKVDPLDFALWKGATADEWGWESPFGRGRPGWHIECSAMSERFLGHGFSVHTGGMDLIFPHHENEIAQSEAAHPEAGPMAQCWLHNGFLNVDKEKMSKSLGNFVTVPDVLGRNDAEGFRWFLLTAHYRAPLQLDTTTVDGRAIFPGIDEAERRVDYLYSTIERLADFGAGQSDPCCIVKDLMPFSDSVKRSVAEAQAALLDDLNTPVALAALGELLKSANELCDLKLKRRKDTKFVGAAEQLGGEFRGAIEQITNWLGLLQSSPMEYRTRTRDCRAKRRGVVIADIESKVNERVQARQARDFARSDSIREELNAWGVVVSDSPTGATWSIGV
jgi:cysteinyl-tRNA synthetase